MNIKNRVNSFQGNTKLYPKYMNAIFDNPFEYKCQNRLSRIVCTTSNENEILVGLLNPNKATGPDEISNKMLKAVSKEISIPLNILFNRSFMEGKFSDISKFQMLDRYRRKEIALILQILDPFRC